MELTNADHHGLAAAGFAFMFALGGSVISFLGAVHPFWRLNMLGMAAMALMTFIIVTVLVPESPIWLLRKAKVSQAEISMRRIRGDSEYLKEFTLMNFAHKKMMEQAETKQNHGNNWSIPLRTIVVDVVTYKRKLPRPPFSFTFLVVLYLCLGWCGLPYIALNGPKIFEVKKFSYITIITFLPASFQDQAQDLGIDKYYMSFIVSLARIPGGLFAAIFLKKFSRRPVFLSSAALMIVANVTMGLTYLDFLPSVFAMVAIAMIQFVFIAGYGSVAGLLLCSLLPSSSRSTFSGIIMSIEALSAISQGSLEPYIIKAVGESGLFFVFGAVIAASFCFMFLLMPETKGKSLEELEHIFLSRKQKGCIVRRDPKEAIASLVLMVRN